MKRPSKITEQEKYQEELINSQRTVRGGRKEAAESNSWQESGRDECHSSSATGGKQEDEECKKWSFKDTERTERIWRQLQKDNEWVLSKACQANL